MKRAIQQIFFVGLAAVSFFSVNIPMTHSASTSVMAQAIEPAPRSPVLEGLDYVKDLFGGFPSGDIREVAARLIGQVLSLVGIILVIMILYGGFLWMTAGGDDEQVSKAKKTIFGAIIGLVLILSAGSIVTFIVNFLSGGAGTQNNL